MLELRRLHFGDAMHDPFGRDIDTFYDVVSGLQSTGKMEMPMDYQAGGLCPQGNK